MVKLVEIGGIIKKGLGQKVVEKFSNDKNVVSVGFANGRASDLFDIQQFGDASEAEVLTLIVKEKNSNSIFDDLYKLLQLDNTNQGTIYKFNAITKASIK
tara:strand:- start:78 stop:377 length:300 start_codon:yes stop_codon:yes gene_type:complete